MTVMIIFSIHNNKYYYNPWKQVQPSIWPCFFVKETKIFAFEPRTSRIRRQVFDTLEPKTSSQNKRGKKTNECSGVVGDSDFARQKLHVFQVYERLVPTLLPETENVKQQRNSRPDGRQTQAEDGSWEDTEGGALSGGRKRELLATKPPDFLIQLKFQEWIPSLHIARFFCFFSRWFSAISRLPTATRADCCRLHTVIGTCFWLGRERKAVAFQGKMCKGSLTLHQRGLPRGPPNITVFMTATTQGREKTSLL